MCGALAAIVLGDVAKIKSCLSPPSSVSWPCMNSTWQATSALSTKPVVFESQDLMYEAFFAGLCDAMTQDSSALASGLATRGKQAEYMVLPKLISKAPLGPLVRRGDDQWLAGVRCSLFALLEAEERTITQVNVDDALKSPDPLARRLFGVKAGNGKALGPDETWAYTIVKQVGNNGESFERNVGMGSPLKLQRDINALWTKGRLTYPCRCASASGWP